MRKYLYWLLPVFWMAIIFLFSSQPYEKQNIQPYLTSKIDLHFLEPYLNWISFTYHQAEVSVDRLGIYGFIEFFIRKGAHVFVFFILCCLFFVALKQSTKIRISYQLIFSFILTFLYAVIDEYHQSFTENRTSYLGDVFLDGFGGGLGVVSLGVIVFLRKKVKVTEGRHYTVKDSDR